MANRRQISACHVRCCLKVGTALFRGARLRPQLAKSAVYGFNTAAHEPKRQPLWFLLCSLLVIAIHKGTVVVAHLCAPYPISNVPLTHTHTHVKEKVACSVTYNSDCCELLSWLLITAVMGHFDVNGTVCILFLPCHQVNN